MAEPLTREQILEAIRQLDPSDFHLLKVDLFSLSFEHMSEEELEKWLLLKFPHSVRYAYLHGFDIESLGAAEYAERVALSDLEENFSAQRLAAIAELAKRRGVELDALLEQVNPPNSLSFEQASKWLGEILGSMELLQLYRLFEFVRLNPDWQNNYTPEQQHQLGVMMGDILSYWLESRIVPT